MTKFILLMIVCSGIPGNDCKSIPTPVEEFNTYHECIYYAYDYSGALLREMSSEKVDEFKMYTRFDCKVDKII